MYYYIMSIPEVNPRQYAHNFKKVPGRILRTLKCKKRNIVKTPAQLNTTTTAGVFYTKRTFHRNGPRLNDETETETQTWK